MKQYAFETLEQFEKHAFSSAVLKRSYIFTKETASVWMIHHELSRYNRRREQ